MASKWAKVVAGAGSVKSSAGTYTACTEVIDPLLVEVIRSCIAPISVANVGWYPTADGIRPKRADTSDPAWVKRKMLSTKNNTSFPWSDPAPSRKYSAIDKPERATRARAPGGSFICPNTNVALDSRIPGLSTLVKSQPPFSIECMNSSPYLIMPDSNISRSKSFPSRVRSPTPANTERPPWPLAMLLINSWINTVFPTPAPPNNPIFPPFE